LGKFWENFWFLGDGLSKCGRVPGEFFAGEFFVGSFFVGKFFAGEFFASDFFSDGRKILRRRILR
jgi:hypothetical protein